MLPARIGSDVRNLFHEPAICSVDRGAIFPVDRDGFSARLARPRTPHGAYAAAPAAHDDRSTVGIAGNTGDQIQREDFAPGMVLARRHGNGDRMARSRAVRVGDAVESVACHRAG